MRRRAAREIVTRLGAAKLAVAAALACLALVIFLALLAALAGATSSQPVGGGQAGCGVPSAKHSPPAALVPIYVAAAEEFHLGSRGAAILAAINEVESDFGRSPLPGVAPGTQNEMGAEGPMQFLRSSWESYGLDGNGDGVKDPYDETDSVFAAAHLLHADGAPRQWYQAIWDYNHADWYVRKVMRIAAGFGAMQCAPSLSPAPLTGLPSRTLARLEYAARWIEAQHIPYCWGGGHGPAPGPSPPIPGGYCDDVLGEHVFGSSEEGLDCSGAVRWLLVLAGFPDPGPIGSGQFSGAFPKGPGGVVTIWSNSVHVFISIDGVDWGTSSSHFRHGPGFGHQPSAGFVPSHPEGF